jgi:solute carrier family 25 (mitochondrial dicarboxylate transporter), member 10
MSNDRIGRWYFGGLASAGVSIDLLISKIYQSLYHFYF